MFFINNLVMRFMIVLVIYQWSLQIIFYMIIVFKIYMYFVYYFEINGLWIVDCW